VCSTRRDQDSIDKGGSEQKDFFSLFLTFCLHLTSSAKSHPPQYVMIRTEFTAGAHLPPPGIAFLGFVLLWCTTTTQCTPGKPGSISQTGSSPTNLKGRDSYQSYWAFGGVSSTSQSFRAQDGGKSRHAEYGERNMHSAESWRSWTRDKEFYAIQLGWVGKCLACKGKCRKTNLKPQPLISMIFTERVREAIAFKAMQIWQTSQHGCGSHQSE